MNYCVNCGNQNQENATICQNCYSDPRIPNEIIEAEMKNIETSNLFYNDKRFGYPGEKSALALAIFISVVLGFILGIVTIGFFILILIINIIYLRIRHFSYKKNLIRVSEKNFPNIFRLAKVAAYRLSFSLPEIYIVEEFQYNAFTMGFFNYGFIVINSSMAKDFKPNELIFVIGHELGHMKKYHTTWLNLMNPLKIGSVRFVFAPIMKIIFNVWSVKAEYTADQAGLIANNDLRSCVTCLLKLVSGKIVEEEVDIDYSLYTNDKTSESLSELMEYLNTHPFIENRIRKLVSFSSNINFRIA